MPKIWMTNSGNGKPNSQIPVSGKGNSNIFVVNWGGGNSGMGGGCAKGSNGFTANQGGGNVKTFTGQGNMPGKNMGGWPTGSQGGMPGKNMGGCPMSGQSWAKNQPNMQGGWPASGAMGMAKGFSSGPGFGKK